MGADTLDNVALPGDVWVDLYDATGISVGTKIKVQNLGVADVQLNAGASTPEFPPVAFVNILRGVQAENDDGDLGAWALSRSDNGFVSVRVA
jgi:hypothetical protein